MDQRRDSLARWAANQIQQQCGLDAAAELAVVSGDASFRRYFRLHYHSQTGDAQQWICVDAPPDKEDNPRFVSIAQRWRAGGVHVPAVLALDEAQGFMLLEDFGDALLWPALHAPDADICALYRPALTELRAIQRLPTEHLPAYDRTLLMQEMALFTDWLCERQLQLPITDSIRQWFSALAETLIDSALAQPQVVVHRDYHSRNLMLCPDGRLGVIDFQDAVVGPLTYDLVSLLRDCYVRWPDEPVAALVNEFYTSLPEDIRKHMTQPQFERAFDLMGMQRHLKAAGIFARLNLRDGKSGYLADIPNTCQYLREIAGRYDEFAPLCDWMDNDFLPALERLPA
ncbi:MAG: phosphotransferase [Pseudomonadota bacterium]|nr:phosphotransferase [Pseudomonadota bacterium]